MRTLYNREQDKVLIKYTKDPWTGCYFEESVFVYQKPVYDATVIIPCYNVEKYIAECLNSVKKQNTSYNVEIIAIDDGSTDATPEILHQYLQKIKNFRVITQPNKGFSGARNTGIRESKGEYLIFIDSDDYVTSDYFEKLLKKALNTNADITACGYFTFDNISKRKIKNITIKSENDISVINGCAWGKAIKRSFFEHLLFPEKYWFEDSIIAHLILPRAKHIYMVPDCQYAYRSNEAGITKTAIKNVRSIESFYITDLMLRTYKYFYSEDILATDMFVDIIVEQFYLNEKRIIKLNSECKKAIFMYQSEFAQNYMLQNSSLNFVHRLYVFGLRKKNYFITQLSLKMEIINKIFQQIKM